MFVLVFLATLVFAGTAFAGDFVCEVTSVPGKYTRYVASQPSITPNPGETCTPVSKANAPAQQEINGVYGVTVNTVPLKYRKVSGGLTVSMTQAEKDAVDAALASQQAARQVFVDEVNSPALCGISTLEQIDTKVDQYYDGSVAAMQADVNAIDVTAMQNAIAAATTSINAATNIATVKDAMTAINAALTTTATQVSRAKTAMTTIGIQVSGERVPTKQTLRCLLAVRKGVR